MNVQAATLAWQPLLRAQQREPRGRKPNRLKPQLPGTGPKIPYEGSMRIGAQGAGHLGIRYRLQSLGYDKGQYRGPTGANIVLGWVCYDKLTL